MKNSNAGLLVLGLGSAAILAVNYGNTLKEAVKKLKFKIVSLKLSQEDVVNNQAVVTGIGSSFWDGLLNFGKSFLKGKTYLMLGIEVVNPTSVELTAPDFSFIGQVDSQGVQIASVNVKKPISVPANGSAGIQIPITVNSKTFLNKVLSLAKGDSKAALSARLTGVIHAMATDSPIDQTFNLIN